MTIRRSRKSTPSSLGSSFRSKRREKIKRRNLLLENLEDRRVMAAGPDLASIQPTTGSLLTAGSILRVSPRDLTFKFSNEVPETLDPASLSTLFGKSSIRITRAGGDANFNNGTVPINPGFIGLGDSGLEVIMRFAQPLPDDSYRIIISGDPSVAGTDLKDTAGNLFNDGKDFKLDFQIELGAQILAVVPQPVVRDATTGVLSQQSNKIDVYFNDDPLDSASVQNVNFYQLIITGNTVSPADDAVVKPTSVTYSLAQNKATLTFASSLTTLNPTNSALRLRIGTNQALDPTLYAPVAANDPLSTFGGALNVGALDGTTSNKVYSDSISPKPYDIVWPGGNDDPGHRDNPAFSNWTETTPFGPLDGEKHLNDGQADGVNGINIRYYNFKNFLGTISDGRGGFQPAFNVITENQKQRAREIFELYSRYSGIQFIESQDLGLTVATADLRVKDPSIPSEPGGVAGLGGGNSSVMDSAETWNDGYGENWFQVAMHEIGHSLGLGHTYDLAPLTIMGDDGSVVGQSPAPEGVFPGDNDIVHMQRLYRPEGQDIDMYKFTIPSGQTGMFSAETFAERLQNSSTPAAPLDTFLRLYRGTELIASNDDYFSKDSLIQLELGAGTYYIGVSAKGNDQYDPGVLDSGMGGTSEGAYKLSFNFRPNVAAANTIVDTTGTQFDGDADGVAGGVFNYWFKTATPIAQSATSHTSPRTLFVDRAAPSGGNGSLATPFNNIATALSKATVAGDIVRIVGNGGADGNLATAGDNLPYQIGFDQQTNAALRDGFTLNVPKNVTVMIDAGAILQLRRAGLQVGSSETTVSTDRSGGALQILGTPTQRVYFTSYNDQTIGVDSRPALNTSPTPGDWGGILFRNDLDNADGRFNWEDHGIFLNYVNFADIRYGGGSITVDNGDPTLNAVHMVDARPTITNNLITRNRDAAMSATPNSFAETNFREPIYQPDGTYAQSFNVDYGRIGPEIHGNTLYVKQGNSVFQNSLNGLLVRTATPAGSTLQEMTVPGRFNDTDIVHIVTENLVINGSPSGPYQEGGTPTTSDPTITDSKPPIALIKNAELGGGSLDAGTYQYRLVYVDSFGNEGRASDVISVTVTGSGNSIRLGTLVEGELPQIPSRFVGMRVYRLGADNRWHFVDQVATSAKTFTDTGKAPVFDRILNPGLLTSTLGEALATNRPRPDGSLRIDPNIVVKFDRGRIEVEMGATMIAEGLAGQNVIFTSLSDDRFGAGATFDTRADGNANPADPGEWGGIYAGPNSRLSLDRASIFYGGGLVQVGGDFAGFNAVEVQQADARIANSLIQFNASGVGGTAPAGRFGRGSNGTASIFVRGAQPVIVNNVIRDNLGAAVNINVNALNSNLVTDGGRQSGLIDRVAGHFDNNGPLIDENRLANNTLNGMVVRGGVLTTEGVWDDTDITHILFDLVSVTDVHTFGGLRLESSASESLVVKAQGSTAGFYANGRPLETDDRIGGILQVLGQPGFPVVITSLLDDTVGAGFQPDLSPMTDANNNGSADSGSPGDWQGIVIDKYAHDRNVDTILEQERTPGLNNNTNTAQKLGALASFQNGGAGNLDKSFEYGGDENLRLGFTVHGNLASKTDLDVYKFKGIAGSQVWVDIDRTTSSLNTIVEVIDSKGAVIASSNNSHTNGGLTGAALPMAATSAFEGRDFFTTNVNDAGMRLVLPGAIGQSADYFVRVRSNGTSLTTGLTQGAYQLQIRLQEKDEFGGTVVRYSDIRFASTGIEVHGLPTHSPLSGEHGDVEANSGTNDLRFSSQNVGNALNVDRGALSIAGELATETDVDWYQFNVNVDKIQGFGPPDLLYSMMFDIDYADGLGRPNTVISIFDDQGRLILSSKDSNVADDQPPPLDAAGVADLLRGSVGNTDAMIGPVLLPAGIGGAAFPGGASKTYYLAVSSDAVLPPQWGQFFSPTSTEALARFQPLDSVHRIAEDHLDPTTQSRGTSELPEVQILLDGQSAVPFNLGDVTLFVNTRDDNRGGVDFNTSHLYTADPFTGAGETKVGAEGGREIEDIGIRSDGGMFAFAQGLQKGLTTDANSDDFVQIDTGNGGIVSSVDTGMITYEPDGNNFAVAHPVNNTRVGWGVQFEALLFADLDFGNEQELIAVGNRGDAPLGYGDPNQNIVYQFTTDGAPRIFWPNLPNGIGAGTNVIEVGEIDTSVAGGAGGIVTGMAKLPSNAKNQFYAIDDKGGLYLVTVNLGANANGATNVVTTQAISNAAFELGGLDFQCLTAGPANVENGRYANTLFATTSTGRMYAFNTQGELQPIFSEGATSIQLTDNEGVNLTDVRGLAFSELDRNLWGNNRGVMPNGVTPRDNDPGHGLPVTFNDSVRPFDDPVTTMPSTEADGGNSVNSSYSFNAWHPHQGDPGSMNYTFNGGAYGTTISNEFSLKSYSSADLPTLYYTYFLNSEDTASGSGHQLRDSVRVFIAGNDGNWQQLGGDDQERDIADTRGENTRDVVGQRMFDNTGTWRQVRINLSDYAGQENLRLRFDFSTAGDMNVGDTETTGDELRAVAGKFITDGDTFTVTRGATNQVFEFDTGVTIWTKPGSEILDGDQITITNNGVPTTFEFDDGSGVVGGNIPISFTATDTAGTLATRLRSAILANVAGATVRYLGDDRLNLDFLDEATDTVTETSGGRAMTLIGQGGVANGNIRVPVHREMTRDEVAVELDKVLEPFLSVQTLVVQGVGGDFSDGDQFSLTVGSPQFGSQTFNFEFDNNSVVTPGFNAVTISGGAGQMANNIRTAISNALIGTGHTARWNINDRARVALQGQYTEVFTYQPLNGSFPLSLTPVNDLVKTHKDLVRIIDETVVDAGPLGLDNGLDGDLLGSGTLNASSGFFSNTRGQDNLHEGIYIDDIIIGLAERGEMVTGSTNDSNYIPNAGLQENQNLVGPYTLEMRRGPTYDFPTILGDSPSFNTNQRLNQSVSIIADAGADIVEGSTFTLSDSVHQVTFEFDFDGSVKPGNIRVPFTADDTANVVASRIRDAINSFPAQQAFDISAQNADGTRTGISTNNQVNLLAGRYSKYATFVDEGPLQVVYNNQAYGDNNRYRDQGQLILDGNRVSNSANWGILIDDGSRDSNAPHTGPARILSQQNTTVPGVVVSNNVVSNSGVGAIRFSGSANPSGSEVGSIPFGRIINNTLYGIGGNSVGIQVDDNAAPTIVNNVIANFGTGVSVAADSQQNTVLDYSVYQSNGVNTNGIATGGSDILLQPADPLFVNAAAGNFYPAPGSKVIDNSINTLVDRPSMVTVRNPLDIPPSPILAPERDATGSLRTDDESVVNQGGAGENPFKDRGALDRVDFVGPTSQLANPLDNDPLGIDGDPTTTKVSLGNVSLFSFEIQLDDVGIGIDDLTVKTSAVKVEQTFPGAVRTLVDGTDYVFSYDSTNNKIILRPTGGIWPLSRNYRITLDNTGADGIRDLAGNLLQGNRVNGSVVYEILLGTAIDYGDAPASYGTTRAGNGASHQIRSAYKLGKQVTPDLDGQPSADASTDTFDDGLINRFLSPGLDSSMTVLAQGGGKLDAWLDRNFDGDFLDAGEHILVGVTLPNNVQKTLSFKFGSTSDKKGDSFLRLRYTSNGISSPVGPASDGEVEDYKVAITGPKYQNPNNPLDVDANGFVQPKDALLIGNLLDNFDLDGDGFLNPNTDLGNPPPNPPPYYDVNGDGRIGRDDASVVVNFINSSSSTLAGAESTNNHAPVLDDAPKVKLPAVESGATDPAGIQVIKLIRNAVTDADPNSVKGIAVKGHTGYGDGTWQFKIDKGPWKNIGNVSDTRARLLPARAYVRFVPNAGFTGEVRLLYRAWDQTQGVPGYAFNTEGKRGGNNSVSLAAETAILKVNPSAAAAMSTTFASSSIVYEQSHQTPSEPDAPVDGIFAAVASTNADKKTSTSVTEDVADDFFSDF